MFNYELLISVSPGKWCKCVDGKQCGSRSTGFTSSKSSAVVECFSNVLLESGLFHKFENQQEEEYIYMLFSIVISNCMVLSESIAMLCKHTGLDKQKFSA